MTNTKAKKHHAGSDAGGHADESVTRVRYRGKDATLAYSPKRRRVILQHRDRSGGVVTILNIPMWSVVNVETADERLLRQLRRCNEEERQSGLLTASTKDTASNSQRIPPMYASETVHPDSCAVSKSSLTGGFHSHTTSTGQPAALGRLAGSLGSGNNNNESSRASGVSGKLYFLHYLRKTTGTPKSLSTIEFVSMPDLESQRETRGVVQTILRDVYHGGERKLRFFVSPKSGVGDAIKICKRHVMPVLRFSRHELEVIVTDRAHHCEDYIADTANSVTGRDVIVCVGGDGMIHEAVNGFYRRKHAALGRSSMQAKVDHAVKQRQDEGPKEGGMEEESTSQPKEADEKNGETDSHADSVGKSPRRQSDLELDVLSSSEELTPMPLIATIPAGSGCGMAKTLNVVTVAESILALVHLDTCVKDLMRMQYVIQQKGTKANKRKNSSGKSKKTNNENSEPFTHLVLPDTAGNAKSYRVDGESTVPDVAERIAFMTTSFGVVNEIDRGSESLRWMGSTRFTAYASYVFCRGLRSYRLRLRYLPWRGKHGQQLQKVQGHESIPSEVELPPCTTRSTCTHCQLHTNFKGNVTTTASEQNVPQVSQEAAPGGEFPLSSEHHQEHHHDDFDDPNLPWVTLDGSHYNVFISNIRSVARDVVMAPRAHMSDGAIDIVFNKEGDFKYGRMEFLKFFTKLESGNHVELPFVSYIKARALELEALEGNIMSDGEMMPFTKVRITPLRRAAEFVRGE
ncbi:putative sphingosine kinase A, B [Trypanosoma grayi]|uniref:putative sphingosine kinase A, B n=1 Tax=Trypanosoma grayi TaxID=71804 RepID=UPI0004F49ABC|nr:putative sphingosine kinase A, B [Trypanosoma grayi]KEG07647.1 putative sphingosine kinase A, B [Trypanosoma grayi]